MKALDYITELPPTALWLLGMGALGWIVTAMLSYRLGLRSKAADRRKAFRDVLALQLDPFHRLVLPQVPAGSLYHMHQNACAIIVPEAIKVEEDIGRLWWRRAGFRKARDTYRALRLEDVEPHDPHNYPLEPNDATKFLFPNLEAGRKEITRLLEQMREYAK